jgi:hypothetical protein
LPESQKRQLKVLKEALPEFENAVNLALKFERLFGMN